MGEIGQIGSQFDGLGHIGMVAGDGKIRYYNGLPQDEVGSAYGLKKLGIEHLKPFFTRGILFDVLAVKGGERLPIGYVITMSDVRATLQRQGTRERTARVRSPRALAQQDGDRSARPEQRAMAERR